MKESIKTVYKCDHCGKNYLRKTAAETHEDRCTKNPENIKPCLSCPRLATKEFIVGYDDMPDGSERKNRQSAMFCTKFETGVYSPVVIKKWGWAYESLETEDGKEYENNPMPESCLEYDRVQLEDHDFRF